MKKLFQKIISLSMALLVLFSTMSFTVDIHYCGKTLVDFSILKKADTCGMEMKQSSISKDNSLKKKSCCKDETLTVDGQDVVKSSIEKYSLQPRLFVASFVYSYLNLFEGLENNIVPYKDYSPPLLIQDIHVLDQAFLI